LEHSNLLAQKLQENVPQDLIAKTKDAGPIYENLASPVQSRKKICYVILRVYLVSLTVGMEEASVSIIPDRMENLAAEVIAVMV
jgi:hypothetical protein